MAGMGQQFNLSGRNSSLSRAPSQPGKRQGLFGEEEGSDSSIHFSIPTSFGAPKPEIMTSPSPSQLSSFGSNMFAQPGSITIQQRGMPTAPFQRTVTPTSMQTSMAPSFPIGLQQAQGQQQGQPPMPQGQSAQGPISPNRNLFNLGPGAPRSLLGGTGVSQGSIGSQIKRSNPMASGIISSTSSTLTSMSAFGRASNFTLPLGTDTAQASIDLSEFPSLGNRSGSSNPLPSAPRSYVGMVSKPVQESAPEFQIQQEDFPALPGAQNPPSAAAAEAARKSDSERPFQFSTTPSSMSGSSTYDQALKDSGKFMGDVKNGQQKRGIQTLPDGTVTNIPSGMVTDQFGMVGLLTFIRAAETDPNLVALAPGIDLTTLGLNLNSPENLYSTFQSPWADAPCRPQDIDFHVPSEYLTNIFIREKLAPIKLNRYQEDLLFFLFYMNGGDVLQLAAAAELYSRDWRYHKEERVWITRAPSIEPVVKTSTYERGTYYFFDVQNWRKVAKEFHLEYDKLEERPHLPTNLQNSTPQPPTPGVLAH